MKKTTVLMVGVGGYGSGYVNELLHTARGERFEVVGAVDPYAEKSRFYEELKEKNIPIYDTVEEFYSIQNGSKEELLAGIDNQAQEIYKNFNALAEMAGEVGERDWTEEESSLAFELLQCIFNANVEIINAYGVVD